MSLLSHLAALIPISKELEMAIAKMSETGFFAADTLLIQKEQRCQDLFYIHKGLIRGYYFKDGKEITNWFAQENEFATCFYAFISQSPSYEIIETLEATEVSIIKHAALQKLYQDFPETERIGRILTENYYIKLEERLLGLQFKTAKERYSNFCTKQPKLLQRASLGQIASYLGITQETLSRIRSEY